MSRLHLLSCLAAAFAAISAPCLQAQTASVAPRIAGPVDETSLTTLKGNVSSLVRVANDMGEATPATQLHSMRLVLIRSSEQEAALEKLMAEQLDKNSPNYQKWLTPEQFGKLYGPADSDVAAIVAWLQSHGFTVEEIPPGRNNIPFSGSVSQVEEAFHTSIHSFEMRGQQFYANTANPQIPSSLTAVVSGVTRLVTYEPQPHLTASRPGQFDPQVGHFTAAEPDNMLIQPEFTSNSDFLWSVPADAATIYDTPNAYNAAFSGTSYTGHGVTIGIAGDSAIQASTVVSFRTRFLNGDTTPPTITNLGNSAVPGNATDEAYIDTELAGGLAPGAAIHFYTAGGSFGGLFGAIQQAISDNTVDILSISFGECEYYLPTSENTQISGIAQQAASQGIAVTVSTGDNGSAGCDDQNSEYTATNGLQVNGLASTPYNIAVGGTDYYGLKSGFSTYVNTNQSSSNFYRSALKYIPEATWNDSTNANGKLANNAPLLLSDNHTHIIGGSGGVSACSTNTDTISSNSVILGTCTHGYAKPTWQRGPGVPNDSARDLPDVSLMAGNGLDSATWLICTDDFYQNTAFIEDCTTQSDTHFYFSGYGGTSTSAPAFAGILALVQEKMGGGGASHRLGMNGAKTLYDLYNGTHASAIFHDVTQGNISMICLQGTPNCSQNTAGNYYETGFDTGTGYDLATGLGSVDATQLINFWGAGTGGGTATVTAMPASPSITEAETDSIGVTVTGSGTTPTGTVTLTGGGYTSSAQTLVAGAFTFNLAAGALAVGTDTLTVTYSGDSNYASTTGSTTITVALAAATVTVTPSSTSISASTAFTVHATVAGSGPTPTGTVSLSGGGFAVSAQPLASGSFTFNIPAGKLAIGTDTLTVTYSGDTKYASTSGSNTVTVTGAAATVTVTPSATSIPNNIAMSVQATVAGSGATPTGTVSLSGGGFTSSVHALAGGTFTFNIPAGKLAVGSDKLTVTYSGDSNYAGTTGTTTVTVTATAATVTVTPSATSIPNNTAMSVQATVAGSGATPTGTVSLSGGGFTSSVHALVSGTFTFNIPAGKLAIGSDKLTVTYSGDSNYDSTTGTTTVTVTATAATVTVTPSATSIPNNIAMSVQATVSGSGATPTGTVSLSGGGFTSSVHALAGGTFTFNIPAGKLAIGSDKLTVTYSGDSNYAATTGNTTVTVTAAAATVTVTPSATSIPSSIAMSVQATVSASGPTPTGTVWLSGGGFTSSVHALAGGTFTFNIPAGKLALGSDKLTVTYSGDSNYDSTTGNTTVTVTVPAATVTVTPSATSIPNSAAMSVQATVSGSGPTPTGTVSLSGGGFTSSVHALAGGTFTFNIPAGKLAIGSDKLTVTYNGDSNYAATTGNTTVTVTATGATVTVTPSATSISADTAMSVQATVAGSGPTPTGTVLLSGGGFTSSVHALAGGTFTFNIPAGKLAIGSDKLTVTYNGDSNYAAATGNTTVTVH